MVVSSYAKQRILDLFFELRKINSQYIYGPISRRLEDEGIYVGRNTVRDIIIRYNNTSTLKRKDGSGRPSKATDKQILLKIETYLKTNGEATSSEIRDYLRSFDHSLSLTTIRRAKAFLGWTFKAPGYCQLIRDVNKTKRLAWARANAAETFDGVIFTDETSVWLEKHKKRCYHKKDTSKEQNQEQNILLRFAYGQVAKLKIITEISVKWNHRIWKAVYMERQPLQKKFKTKTDRKTKVLAIASQDKLNPKPPTNTLGNRTLYSQNVNKSKTSGKRRTYTDRDNSSVSYSIQAPKTKIPRRKTEKTDHFHKHQF